MEGGGVVIGEMSCEARSITTLCRLTAVLVLTLVQAENGSVWQYCSKDM